MSIQFEICRDTRLLNQYYQLREECFRNELGIPDFDGSEEYQDRRGQIVVAIKDGNCIGGVRISSHLNVHEQLHELNLQPHRCCIWERFVVSPTARSMQMVYSFIAHAIEASYLAGYQYAVMVSSMKNARLYRHCHSQLGIDFEIHHEVPDCAKGAFEGLEHYLSVSHVHKVMSARLAA